MTPSGSLFYQDYASQQYHVEWETVGNKIDITTITKQPYVWGEAAQGYIKNRILYRRGIITVLRQLMQPSDDGYEIIADGSSQYIDFIQMNYPCGGGPSDPFAYHLDHVTANEIEMRISDGPHWADPAEDDDSIWSDIAGDGSAIDSTGQELEWIDVWS